MQLCNRPAAGSWCVCLVALAAQRPRSACAAAADPTTRLVGSDSPGSGLLEVQQPDGTWGSVCPDGFGQQDASVACRTLGFQSPITPASRTFYRRTDDGSSPARAMGPVNCTGEEQELKQCRRRDSQTCSADPAAAAGVDCLTTTALLATGVRRRLGPRLRTAVAEQQPAGWTPGIEACGVGGVVQQQAPAPNRA